MAPGTVLVLLLGTAQLTWPLYLRSPVLFWGDPEEGFGSSVAQFGTGEDGWVLVGAPLARPAPGDPGSLFRCRFRSRSCQKIPVRGPAGAVNASLGLALAAGEEAALVCGPTCPQTCGVNVHLNGFCVQLDSELRPVRSFPEKFPECPKPAMDIAILMDGSGSIAPRDFRTMKEFIAAMMERFRDTDAQFSLTQFSSRVHTHFDFNTFRNFPDPALLLRNVRQIRGLTATATAILTVLREMFVAARGARPGVRRILIVVTDGEKYGDNLEYSDVIPLADSMAVTRYAIGVGSAFQKWEAQQELQVIASSPAHDHLFRVDNFDALQGIQEQLQEKIFAIEGTRSARSSSFQLEMAQEGFSVQVTPAGFVLGAVGAFDWSGGAFLYSGGGAPTFLNVSGAHLGTPGAHLGTPGAHLGNATEDMRDAYLGYSLTAVSLGHTWALALGAPRYAHLGRVLLLQPRHTWDREGHTWGDTWTLLGEAMGTQVGSYFGASLLALKSHPGEPGPGEPGPGEPGPGESRPGEPLRLLVGAPLFYGEGSGGRVELCELDGQSPHLRCHLSLRGSPGHPLGRFGASLAHLGDLDGDRWPEVAVGAPLEDEGRGAVYLFRGTPGGVSAQGAQRIPGSSFPSQPRFFGQSLSGGRDLSGDHLPDLAVGAHGQVLLLRSPPLLQVRIQVSFQPQVIPAAAFECLEGEEPRVHLVTAQVCFEGTKITRDNFAHLSLPLRFRAELDPGRVRVRGIFGNFPGNGTLSVGEGRRCESLRILRQGCPRDTLTPLGLRVTLEGFGDPLEGTGELRPELSPDSDTTVMASVPFEHDCGSDNVCQDSLRLRLRDLGVLVVGEGDALEVTVTLRNEGEDSFGAAVILEHSPALSFRKVQVLQFQPRSGSLRCHSEPPWGRGRRTLCQVQPPVLRGGAQVIFNLTLDVPPDADLGDSLELTVNATSDNGVSGGRGQRVTIPVRYQVLLVLTSSGHSTRYLNVTRGGASPPPAPVSHHYQVKLLGRRGLEANVTFWVPTHLGREQLWEHLEVTPEQEAARCQEGPEHLEHTWTLPPERPLLVCPGPTCRQFRCSLPHLSPPQVWGFRVGGRLKLTWMAQVPQPKLYLSTSAQVSFDQRRFHNTWGDTELQVQTELEHLSPPPTLPWVLGGSLGALLLLGALGAALRQAGFFKRRYKELLESAETPGDPQG